MTLATTVGMHICNHTYNRRDVCTDVLNAHLMGTAVPCKKVPGDVRDAFERMELFHWTRSSRGETMVCVVYNFKLVTFEVSQHSKTGGTCTKLVQKRTQKEADQVSFRNTVIITLPRCLKRDEKKKVINHA
jgi:hypothetical protein